MVSGQTVPPKEHAVGDLSIMVWRCSLVRANFKRS